MPQGTTAGTQRICEEEMTRQRVKENANLHTQGLIN